MITCREINKFIRQGRVVYARPISPDKQQSYGERLVLRARAGLCDMLQVQFEDEGQRIWRNADYSSVRVANCEK